MFNKKRKIIAFTLIELLVVIAIIGILATLAVVALQNSRKNARDAKRVSDIKQIQTALELYFNDQGLYPLTGEIDVSIATGSLVYMAKTPSAPNPPDGYCSEIQNNYRYKSDDGSTYTIDFCTGSRVGELPPGIKMASPFGIFSCGDNFLDFRDGQVYSTVQIGSQCWMAENMKYDNGCSSIPWVNSSDVGWCGCYDNASDNCNLLGRLYQWSAAMNGSTQIGDQGICPPNWHLPIVTELTLLTNYLGGVDLAGKELKAVSPDWDGNNNSGFKALASGFRLDTGAFNSINSATYFWSSTELDVDFPWSKVLLSDNSTFANYISSRPSGYSVRCLKD